jgi:hypothetical protein
MFTLEYDCRFGWEADPAPAYVSGWYVPESGFTWMGSAAALDVPATSGVPHVLELHLSPCARPEVHPAQRIIVRVNSVVVGAFLANNHSTLAFVIPQYLSKDRLRIQFECPDAVDVRQKFGALDDRRLGFNFSRLRLFRFDDCAPRFLTATEGNVFANFESLGDNCELGLVQRISGLEQLGLLRFSGQQARFVVTALDERFEAFENPNLLELTRNNVEYSVFFRAYSMAFHTYIDPSKDEAVVRQQQITRLRFLARKFLEDVRGGTKVFVLKRNVWLHDPEVLPIYVALNRIGRTNMLVIRPADAAHPSGSVTPAMPGLFYGYIGQLAPYADPQVKDFDSWRQVCEATMRLVSGS